MPVEHGISVALLRPMAELMARVGVDPAAYLASLGIDEDTTPETYVAGELVDRRFEELAASLRDPAFALTLARAAVARPVGMFGHMVWLSGTVRDALTRAAKFYGMVTRRTRLTLEEEPGGLARLRQHAVDNMPRGRFLTEYAFGQLALRARAATGGAFALRAVAFAHAGEPAPAYREVFQAPVAFGAALDEIELDAAQLDLRIAGADPITSAALEEKVARLAAGPPGRSTLVDRVRRAAAAGLESEVTLATVAQRLGVSARTLRRNLEQEGTTLRGVIDELRRERADELLAAGTPVKEIAFSLGFSEPSAFSRAYKRWTGHAPGVVHRGPSTGDGVKLVKSLGGVLVTRREVARQRLTNLTPSPALGVVHRGRS